MPILEINWILADALADPDNCNLSGLTLDLYSKAGIVGVSSDDVAAVNEELFRTYKLMNTNDGDVSNLKSLSVEDIRTIIEDLGMPKVLSDDDVSVSADRKVISIKFNMDICDNSGDAGLLSYFSISFDGGQTFDNSLLKNAELNTDCNNLLSLTFTKPLAGPVLILMEAAAVKNISSNKVNPATTLETCALYNGQNLDEDSIVIVEIINDIKELGSIFVTHADDGLRYTHIGIEYDKDDLDWLYIYVALQNVDVFDENKIQVVANCLTEGYQDYYVPLEKVANEYYFYKCSLSNDFLAAHDFGKKFNVTVTYNDIEIESNDYSLVIPKL